MTVVQPLWPVRRLSRWRASLSGPSRWQVQCQPIVIVSAHAIVVPTSETSILCVDLTPGTVASLVCTLVVPVQYGCDEHETLCPCRSPAWCPPRRAANTTGSDQDGAG